MGRSTRLVVITDDRFGDAEIERSILEPANIEVRVASCRTSQEVISAARSAEGLLVNLAPIDAAALEGLERCRVISRYGVGLDNVDVEAATRRNIVVRNVPGFCDQEVAEQALALLFACARGTALRDRSIRAGEWNIRPYGKRIAGTTLGILGFGGTGICLARSALGLGFARMLVWSPHISQERIGSALGAGEALPAGEKRSGPPVSAAGFEEVLANSDWISIHLPLTPETRGIIGAREIGLMRSDTVIVNVSRGAVMDEGALVAALEAGRIGGAGLDVFAVEPLPRESRLRRFPTVVLSDHTAYASRESILELRRRTAQNALDELSQER